MDDILNVSEEFIVRSAKQSSTLRVNCVDVRSSSWCCEERLYDVGSAVSYSIEEERFESRGIKSENFPWTCPCCEKKLNNFEAFTIVASLGVFHGD